jgi:hypothetical protein
MGIFLVMAVPLPLLGEELKLIPSLAVKEEYNDNIFLATGAGQADFVTTLTPSLDISSATERGSATLSAGLNLLDYNRHAGLNAVDYFGQGGLGYRFSPRLTISAGAGYVRDSRPDRIDVNGLALNSGSNRQNYQLSGNYALSEKSNSSVSYAYSQEDFENSGLLSTRVHSATLSQDYDLDRFLRQTRLVGSFGYSHDLTSISQVDNYTATLGLTKKLHELWGFSLNAGGRYTHSAFDVQTSASSIQVVSSDDQGWVGNLSLNYSGESLNSSLTFNHDITTASGRAGSTARTGVSVNLEERFTREIYGSFGMGYSWNKTDRNQFSTQPIDETNLNLNCVLRYDFTNDAALEGSYRYNSIDRGQSGTHAGQNVFILRLTLRRDLMDL